MKIGVKELRNGTMIYLNQQVMQVLEFQCMNEIYHLKVMNFSTHKKEEFDIQSKEMVEKIVPNVFKAELNCIEGNAYHFFDLDTYDLIEVDKSVISDTKWMIGSPTCTLYSYNGNIYNVETDRYIEAKVIKIESGFPKYAVLENGVKVQLTFGVCVGDIIKIDTFAEMQVDL